MRKGILLLIALVVFMADLSAQDNLDQSRREIKTNFSQEFEHLSLSKPAVLLKARSRNIPVIINLASGESAQLLYFDELDQPVYYRSVNVNAAKTTGTVALQTNGSLGVNLTGKGMVVGIYDQTRPKIDHVEYKGRLTQVDGSTETISNHATHVTGTIMASGVSANAKGMATETAGWAFNWEADLDKMMNNAYDPISKAGGHLVSNHSYGVVLGWYRNSSNAWAWAGNPSVDPNEDYRFGFYSTKSKGLDDLIFSKPYYTVVWAAGNDRGDSGDGSRDADGPDDTIGPEGVAKNVITVGAVNNVSNYSGPSDISMSSFSSWGPTDDGRIKPDLVGMGVNVYSSAVANGGSTDSYASLSGTSMASPNVTGSLLLLQQLYSQRNSGRYMWASTVKALALNTTKEAGQSDGPDYVYGWGLLDAEAAGKIILNENGTSEIIREENLEDGESYSFEFVSDGITPIRVTVAWTDPSGSPAAPSLDPSNLMLVNDLDLRIIDEQGEVYFPWTLNPAGGPGARAEQNKDNFRDNVEQVSIKSPKPQKYRVVVSHKGELVNSSQDFSLVMKAGASDGADETLYWIGGNSGSWNAGANWSLSSSGSAANKVPGVSTRVVFDGSSDQKASVTLPSNASAFSLNLFGNQPVDFDFNSNQMQLSNGLRVSNQATIFQNGAIIFANSGDNEQIIEVGKAGFAEFTLNFSSGSWEIIDAADLGNVAVGDASLSIGIEKLQVESLSVSNSGVVVGSLNQISFENDLTIANVTLLKENLDLTFEGTNGTFSNSGPFDFNKLIVSSGRLTISSGGFNSLNISNGEALLGIGDLSVTELAMGTGSILNLGTSGELTVSESISSSATSTGKASITAGVNGKLIHDVYLKYCFDHLNVNNVDLVGDAIINLGSTSTVVNSSDWLQQPCEEVIFANFSTSYSCVGAAVTFQNLSEGAITDYLWDFSGLGTSVLEDPFFVFPSPGEYTVKLRVSNDAGFTEYEQEIVVGSNPLQQPIIVANGNVLTSQQPGTSYQWYRNGAILPGATLRSYEATGDGLYQVAIFDETCNRISEPVVISAILDQEVELSRFGIFIGPNPTDLLLNVRISNDYMGPVTFRIIDMSGRVNREQKVYKNERDLISQLELTGNAGIYLLQIEIKNITLHKKIIKQ